MYDRYMHVGVGRRELGKEREEEGEGDREEGMDRGFTKAKYTTDLHHQGRVQR